jgi:hypothetical protein
MISGYARGAFALASLLLAACQMLPPVARGTRMDGQWASSDGVFIASFQGGQFTSRFIKTNEVLAQGTYSVAGDQVSMQWLSVATQQQRSASCTLGEGAAIVHCNQAGGGSFDLMRTA